MDSNAPADPAPPGFTRLPRMGGPFIREIGPVWGRTEGPRSILGLRIEPRHTNGMDNAHGGMLLGFLDVVLAAGASRGSGLDRFMITVNVTADFLAGARLGTWLEGSAELLRVTRNFVFAQTVLTADGTPVLRGSGVLKPGPEMRAAVRS